MELELEDDAVCNPSDNEELRAVVEVSLTRRQILQGALGAAAVAFIGGPKAVLAQSDVAPRLHRGPVVAGRPGAAARRLHAPGASRPGAIRSRAGRAGIRARPSSADEQAAQMGMHADGLHFFSLPQGSNSSEPRPPLREQRVHRRGPAAPGRPAADDRREGAQVAGGARRHHRGDRPQRRPLGGGAALELRPAPDGLHAHALRGSGRGPPAAADEHGSRRPQPARHAQQLRDGRDALGHVPDLRGELQPVLRPRPGERRADGRPAPLRPAERRQRARLGDAGRTLRRLARAERVQPLRLGGRDRPLRPEQHAGEAHGARPHRARGRDGHARARRARGRVHG